MGDWVRFGMARRLLGAKAEEVNIKLLILFVLLVAVSFRVWGIGYDLPYIYHPDEPDNIARSQNMFKTGDLNPRFFHYPSLFFYVNSLAYIPYYLAGKLLGVLHDPNDIAAPLSLAMGVTRAQMPTTVLLGRSVTVIFGVGCVLLTFLIGTQLTSNTTVGLLAALMMAMSPTDVWNNRLVTPDTFVTFFALSSFLTSVLVFQQGRTWHYIAAGICVGLTASSKYNGGLIALSLLFAHFLRCGREGFKDYKLYSALLAGLLAFLATTPFALLDFPQFMAGLRFNATHYSTGHAGMEGDTVQWYSRFLLRTTGAACLLAVLEILNAICSKSRPTMLLSAFPLGYFLFISRFVVRNDRTIMPLIPFLFLLAAALLVRLFGRANIIEAKNIRNLLVAALSGLVVACLVVLAGTTLHDNTRLTALNSRETARIWIAKNLPPGARIAIESYAPFVAPEQFSVQGFDRMIDNSPDWYGDNGFEFLVFSQGMFGRFYREPDRYRREVAQYNSLFSELRQVKVFTDGGYEVRVYQVGER